MWLAEKQLPYVFEDCHKAGQKHHFTEQLYAWHLILVLMFSFAHNSKTESVRKSVRKWISFTDYVPFEPEHVKPSLSLP